MNDPTPPADSAVARSGARPDGLERRAAWLVVLLIVLLLASAGYLMYARGVFEPTQRLVLIADDSEGVSVGMDLTFSGFPIGRVARIELAPDGRARIVVDVPRRDAQWLRTRTVFTLTRGLVGNVSLRAYTNIMTDPLLPDGAEQKVLSGDAGAEIPRILGQVRDLVANLTALTQSDSALATTLAHAQTASERLAGPTGGLGLLMGNPADARRVVDTLQRTQALLGRLDALVGRADGVVEQASRELLGPQGLVPQTTASVQQLQGLLAQARGSLQRVDGVLADAQATARQVRVATSELDTLRAEVDASLRKVDGLVADIHRRWPFKRDTEVRLP